MNHYSSPWKYTVKVRTKVTKTNCETKMKYTNTVTLFTKECKTAQTNHTKQRTQQTLKILWTLFSPPPFLNTCILQLDGNKPSNVSAVGYDSLLVIW